MSLMISNVKSSTQEMLRKNMYFLQFTSVPGNTAGSEDLAFACIAANRPEWSVGEKESKRFHENFYQSGGFVTWNSLETKFYDFIQGNSSASQIMWNWATAIYNPVTGQMFYKTQYTTTATLALLSPDGAIIEAWNLYYVFPTKINWGEVGNDDDGFMTVSASFRYDFAIKSQSATQP